MTPISAPPTFAERDFSGSRRVGAGRQYAHAYVKGSGRTPHPLVANSEVFAS